VKPFDGRLASLLALSRIHETGGVYPRGIQLHFERADGPKMEALDYWRLCDELNVIQAALLVVGCDPSGNEESIELYPDKSPPGYQAAKIAISNALCRKEIAGQIVPLYDYNADCDAFSEIDGTVNAKQSRVEVASLRTWLAARGVKTGCFFPDIGGTPDYLDPRHPRYAPKLAAAVHAWLAIENESAVSGKSPKQALVRWLREQAVRFGLTDGDGKPNETGIEEIAKVANWQPSGGAPKTPSG
jgi:hypothetical protein